MKTNRTVKAETVQTHGGAVTHPVTSEKQLRRAVMSCMLWESNFYENGVSIAQRITDLVAEVPTGKCAEIAIEAREKMKLRHVPLLILSEMAKKRDKDSFSATINGKREFDFSLRKTVEMVIQRPDEMGELISIYWMDGKKPLASQLKRGIALAFKKFNAYQLGKYRGENAKISLRDVLFLTHPKADSEAQQEMWDRLVGGTLETPDTWEVALSSGEEKKTIEEKKAEFERLLKEEKLGALALLRNLRNMCDFGVDKALVKEALKNMKIERVLPFRFIAAARAVPNWESLIEPPMLRCLSGSKKLPGKTVVLVDISGSMDHRISEKSDLTRADAGCGLAILAKELCEEVEIFSFSYSAKLVPDRRGFALSDAILKSQEHGGTNLGGAVKSISGIDADRLIIITDEQSTDYIPNGPFKYNYSINVGVYQNGVSDKNGFTSISGWSEAVFDYIIALEEF